MRIAPDNVTTSVKTVRPVDRQVRVCRQRFARMPEPCAIGPRADDEVLDDAQAPNVGPGRAGPGPATMPGSPATPNASP